MTCCLLCKREIKMPPAVQDATKILRPKNRLGVRHLQFFLLFLWIVLSHSARASLSVAILAMTEKNPNKAIPTYPEWSNMDTILSSYFWGYIMPATGLIVKRFGPKWTLVVTTATGGLSNILIPVLAANIGSVGVIVCRVIQGVTQSFVLAVVHSMMSQWAPFSERTKTANFILSGTAVAALTAMPITGAICASQGGWPVVFYFYGASLIVLAVTFAYFGADLPRKCKFITEEEKFYIESECTADKFNVKAISTPWISIFLSMPTWAIIVAHFGSSWGVFTLLTQIPSYMSYVMNFKIQDNGFLSGLPYLVQWIICLFSGYCTDKLIAKRIFNVTVVRKMVNSIYFLGAGVSLLVLGFIDSSQKVLAVFLLVIAVGSCAFSYSGCLVNPADLSPNHSANVIGISNCIANFASILGPLTVQYFDGDKDDLTLWRTVFCLAAGIYFFSGLFYIIFASGEIQTWDKPKDSANGKTRLSS